MLWNSICKQENTFRMISEVWELQKDGVRDEPPEWWILNFSDLIPSKNPLLTRWPRKFAQRFCIPGWSFSIDLLLYNIRQV